MRLRDYFFEATQRDLLSISYNPDARYAFVNFRTESARVSAIHQAAYTLFDTKRLDCRIRQTGSNRSTKINYGLDSGRPGQPISISNEPDSTLHHKVEEISHFPEADSTQNGKDKSFILKSYSLHTLERSLALGVWQLPRRHVVRLNHAFQTASRVFLFLSVNGSGRFFGYASMQAPIRDENEPALPTDCTQAPSDDLAARGDCDFRGSDDESQSEWSSRRPSLTSRDSSLSVGSISYDAQRRKIMWNATRSCHTDTGSSPSKDLPPSPPLSPTSLILPSSENLVSNIARYTCSCQIKWLSTEIIKFEEMRGLRNAWNSYKEIHIARNVTAVEPSVAKSLLRCWEEREEIRRMSLGSRTGGSKGGYGRSIPLGPSAQRSGSVRNMS